MIFQRTKKWKEKEVFYDYAYGEEILDWYKSIEKMESLRIKKNSGN